MKIDIPIHVIRFSNKQKIDWIEGNREDCLDLYCKNYPGSYGFGEYLVGKHFEEQGYLWIHHDFNIFGGNKLGKYPKAEEVIINYVGKEKYELLRNFNSLFKPLEEPDLLIYKPDFSEIRFAEAKRKDTRDKIRESQVRGLALFSLLLNVKVEIYEIVED